jgi:hypothetical protein
MNKKKVLSGLVLILIGIWIYTALSSFKIEENSFPKKMIIQEGIVRTSDEVAGALAKEMDFDLDGAYKSGYTPDDVIEYLINEPHSLSVTFHEGQFYTGQRTVLQLIPLSVAIVIIVIGIVMVLVNLKTRKSD